MCVGLGLLNLQIEIFYLKLEIHTQRKLCTSFKTTGIVTKKSQIVNFR